MAQNEIRQAQDSLNAISGAMLSRINTGYTTLTSLEQRLIAMVNGNNLVANDPEFLLELCKYFRGSINLETKIILEFISNLKSQRKVLPLESGSTSEAQSSGNETIDKLRMMDPQEREALRAELENSKGGSDVKS